MKKFFMLFIIAIPIVLIFAACTTKASVVGVYYFIEAYGEGKTYTIGETMNGVELTENSAVLTLNNDEDSTGIYADLENPDGIQGKWKFQDGIVKFTSNTLQTVVLTFEVQKDGKLFLVIEDNAVLKLAKK